MNTELNPSLISHGLTTCEGCLMELIARHTLEILGSRTIVLTPPSCSAILMGYGEATGLRVPGFQSNLENIAAYCSGIREGLEAQGKDDIHIVAFAGDGGTVDIGLQALSAAIERGHRFIYICYDNEAYMNTGIQRSGSTPEGAWTTTTPGGKNVGKKNIVGMLHAQGLPYLATASAGYIKDFRKKIKKASLIDGPSYIHVLTPCPAGWRFKSKDGVKLGKLAVNTNLWPLFEIENGKTRITRKVANPKPIEEYLSSQGRFAMADENLATRLTAKANETYRNLETQSEAAE